MRHYTIIGVEYDGSEYELAHVDNNPDDIIYAAKLKRRRMFNRHQSGQRRYLNVYAIDNRQQLGDVSLNDCPACPEMHEPARIQENDTGR
jgi:hypothetical protein